MTDSNHADLSSNVLACLQIAPGQLVMLFSPLDQVCMVGERLSVDFLHREDVDSNSRTIYVSLWRPGALFSVLMFGHVLVKKILLARSMLCS